MEEEVPVAVAVAVARGWRPVERSARGARGGVDVVANARGFDGEGDGEEGEGEGEEEGEGSEGPK